MQAMNTRQLYLRYSLLVLALCALVAPRAYAQYGPQVEKKISDEERLYRGATLKAYRIQPNTGLPVRAPMPDTLSTGAYKILAPESRSLAVGWQGSTNHPWQSKLFFDRRAEENEFVFFTGYQGMLYTPADVQFYDTKTPFTLLNYHKNFDSSSEESVIRATLSTNVGKEWNFGASLDYVDAMGYYTASRSKNARYRVFGSYNSDRYDLWAYIANDYYKQAENAGIIDLNYILNPDEYSQGRYRVDSKDVPVAITSNSLYNRIRYGHAYLSHRYKLGYRRSVPRQHADTLRREPEAEPQHPHMFGIPETKQTNTPALPDSSYFVPVGGITHQLYYTKANRRFIASEQLDLWDTLFGTPAYRHTRTDSSTGVSTTYTQPNDLMELRTLRNSVSLNLMEGFRPWVKFGLAGYVRMENHWLELPTSDPALLTEVRKYYSTYVGGQMYRHSGGGVGFDVVGEVALLGKDQGAVRLSANLETSLKIRGQEFALLLDGKFLNTPAPITTLLQRGTYNWWDKDFNFTRRLELGAKLDLRSWRTWVEARTASLQNHIYWNRSGEPEQNTDLFQVLMLRAGHAANVGVLHWDLEGAYQVSGSMSTLPLPKFSARANLFLRTRVAKVLRVELGLEGYWHSAYYAPYYLPTNQQYVLQDELRVGGDTPLVNAYANFKLKGTKFYLKMFNFGELFLQNNRLSLARYVYNPPHIQAGIAVDLHN